MRGPQSFSSAAESVVLCMVHVECCDRTLQTTHWRFNMHCAQASAVMVGVSADLADKEFLVYFMAIDKCKFRRKVGPGDVLELHVSVMRGKPGGKVWKFLGRAEVEGELACEAEFTAMVDMPKE